MNKPLRKRHACLWGLYLITDEDRLADPAYPDFIGEALRCGVRVVQLRAKHISDRDLFPIGAELRRITRIHQAALIVNDRPNLARELEADGVHVGQDDTPVSEARRILGPDRIVGLSTHGEQEILEARTQEVDYIGVGPVFRTATKQDAGAPTGLEMLRFAARETSLPLVAIGGIDLSNIRSVLEAGAPNIAVISAISRAGDPLEATRHMLFEIGRFLR